MNNICEDFDSMDFRMALEGHSQHNPIRKDTNPFFWPDDVRAFSCERGLVAEHGEQKCGKFETLGAG